MTGGLSRHLLFDPDRAYCLLLRNGAFCSYGHLWADERDYRKRYCYFHLRHYAKQQTKGTHRRSREEASRSRASSRWRSACCCWCYRYYG